MKKQHLKLAMGMCMGMIATVAYAKSQFQPHNEHFEVKIKSSGMVNKSFVPPVLGKYANVRNLRDVTGDSTEEQGLQLFVVSYQEAVTQEARTALEYALSIWETHITSSQKINVHVRWNNDPDESSTLASAGPRGYYAIEESSLLPAHWAPAAIYNRKMKTDASPSPDMGITIVERDDFYFGTDGNCPEDKIDFVSTMIHEVGHGLGFISTARREVDDSGFSLGSTNYNGLLGAGGGAGYPFDYFLQDYQGNFLMNSDSYESPSNNLYTALTNNNLYFDSPLTKAAYGGNPVKLYAPMIWSDGSSVSHVDEGTFPAGNIDSMMSPKADLGEANHNPGPIALAMLGDMGWDHVWLNHTSQKDTEDLVSPVRVVAEVESDSPLQGNPVLAYRIAAPATDALETVTQEQPFTSLPMIFDPVSSTYFQDIALDGSAKDFEYYIQANASGGRVFQAPAHGETEPFTFSVGPDTTPPVMAHYHNSEYTFSNVPSITLFYEAADNLGLSSLVTEVWLDGVPIDPVVYSPTTEETEFFTTLQIDNLAAYQTLQYRFTATDSSVAQNQAKLPSEGFYALTIEPIYDPVSSYSNNFDSETTDFILEGFEISTPEGFTNGTLGSKHPYDNTGTSRINTYAYLRQQIQVQVGTTISFDQIVLVEPGEDGAVFPDEDQYDFVVVEASKDQGATWIAIEAGWDSTEHTDFLTSYNANTDESNNSSTLGIPSMFKPKSVSFDNSLSFIEGDVVMIRFRLLSDPLAVGWGWTIDNLQIGVTPTP